MKSIYALLIHLFLILATIHFYWALGGTWGFENALPRNTMGDLILNPRPIESAIVGLDLLAFAVFYYLKLGWSSSVHLPNWMNLSLSWLIPVVFLLRAIGDLKYVGFFKTISLTTFGKLDTYYYSPLCLIIALCGFTLLWNKQ